MAASFLLQITDQSLFFPTLSLFVCFLFFFFLFFFFFFFWEVTCSGPREMSWFCLSQSCWLYASVWDWLRKGHWYISKDCFRDFIKDFPPSWRQEWQEKCSFVPLHPSLSCGHSLWMWFLEHYQSSYPYQRISRRTKPNCLKMVKCLTLWNVKIEM